MWDDVWTGLSSTFGFFDDLYHLGDGFFLDLITGAIDYLANALGLPSLEQVQQLAGAVDGLARQIWSAVGDLATNLKALAHHVAGIDAWAQGAVGNLFSAVAHAYSVIVLIINHADDWQVALAQQFLYLQEYALNRYEAAVGLIHSEIAGLKLDLPGQIQELVAGAAAPVILMQAEQLIQANLGPLQGQVADLAQQVEQEEECCTANSNHLRDDVDPLLNKLKDLLGLLALLEGLSASGLLHQFEDWINSAGGDVVSVLSDWLET